MSPLFISVLIFVVNIIITTSIVSLLFKLPSQNALWGLLLLAMYAIGILLLQYTGKIFESLNPWGFTMIFIVSGCIGTLVARHRALVN
jgi:hypothetical protein